MADEDLDQTDTADLETLDNTLTVSGMAPALPVEATMAELTLDRTLTIDSDAAEAASLCASSTGDARPRAESPERADSAAAERGLMLGRYIVLARLGAGAMGVVFAAYDPDLDRKVALKLLKHRGADLYGAQRRMQREAQALAKLAHPNVVGVYDVGVVEGQLFIAMEFVEGQTLGAWMESAAQPHPWAQVLEVFIAAGQGLAAAHEVGLIHRDFKPDNVMLGVDGRVRVMDFGLASGSDSEAEDDVGNSEDSLADLRGLPDTKLTMTGMRLGTPAYMSWEQFVAGKVDARSDQFGFCVALYEALYGVRPFPGETIDELLAAVGKAQLRPDPEHSRVPAWLRAVVVRGLAKAPQQRHTSMQALLEALADDPIAKRRRWLARAASLAAGIAGLAGLAVLGAKVAKQRAEITSKQEELTRQNIELRAQRDRATTELTKQKGLRASMLAEFPASGSTALSLALEAAGGVGARALEASEGALPEPVFSGLVGAVVAVEAGLPLVGHEDHVTAVAYAPAGELIATASRDASVRIWEASSGTFTQTLAGHAGPIHALAISPDGLRAATASADETARVWALSSGEVLATLEHDAPVHDLAFAPGGEELATATQGGAVHVWPLSEQRAGAKPQPRISLELDGPVRELAYAATGEQLVTAGEHHSAQLWNTTTGALVRSFEGHEAGLSALAVSPASARVASGSVDGSARVWDLDTGELLALLEHGEAVHALAFSPDGSHLAAGTWDDDAAHLWQLGDARRVASFQHAGPVLDLAFSPRGDALSTASWDQTARVWPLDSARARVTLSGHQDRVDAISLSPDGALVATGSGDNTARLWDARTGAALFALRGHTLEVVDTAFSADNSLLVTASWDHSARVWDTNTGAPVAALSGHEARVHAANFSPDGRQVVTAGADKSARIWDARTGALISTLEHAGPVLEAMYSPTGELLATLSANGADRVLRLWDVRTASPWQAGASHVGMATAAAFSPDGSQLAVATKGHAIELWTPSSGEVSLRLTGHLAPITSLAFAAESPCLVSASADGTARVWSLAAAGELLVTLPHTGPVQDLDVSADGRRVLTADAQRVAQVWPLDSRVWFESGCALLEGRSAHTELSRELCPATQPAVQPPPPPADLREIVLPPPPRETLTEHGVEFVLIPGGSFSMGSPEGRGNDDEHPRHEVTLAPFYMARTELTNAQYARYLAANPELDPPAYWHDVGARQAALPVTLISWSEARAYCEWAGFQLPTEAQWEYAARAGTTSDYWYGDDVGEAERFSWVFENSGKRVHVGATKDANAFGLYDMAGNVWEWTRDAYHGNDDYQTPARPRDGLRHPPIGGDVRVMRSGSWLDTSTLSRVGFRFGIAPTYRDGIIGFRPCRTVPEGENKGAASE